MKIGVRRIVDQKRGPFSQGVAIYIYIYMALDRFAAYILAKNVKNPPVL